MIDHDGFVIADIPGLIEGAHEGAGLGDRFLGHVERCRVLVHLVDGTQDDVADAYKTIRTELAAYDEALADKPELVVLNKIDALTPEDIKTRLKALSRASGSEAMAASGVSGQGVEAVLHAVLAVVDADTAERAEAARRAAQPHWAP
jgi:GTP-binding protein